MDFIYGLDMLLVIKIKRRNKIMSTQFDLSEDFKFMFDLVNVPDSDKEFEDLHKRIATAFQHGLEELGLKLKPGPRVKSLACVCGASYLKRRCMYDFKLKGMVTRCSRCGLEGPSRKDPYQSHKAFNDMIIDMVITNPFKTSYRDYSALLQSFEIRSKFKYYNREVKRGGISAVIRYNHGSLAKTTLAIALAQYYRAPLLHFIGEPGISCEDMLNIYTKYSDIYTDNPEYDVEDDDVSYRERFQFNLKLFNEAVKDGYIVLSDEDMVFAPLEALENLYYVVDECDSLSLKGIIIFSDKSEIVRDISKESSDIDFDEDSYQEFIDFLDETFGF
jgi:hypothetical protein